MGPLFVLRDKNACFERYGVRDTNGTRFERYGVRDIIMLVLRDKNACFERYGVRDKKCLF